MDAGRGGLRVLGRDVTGLFAVIVGEANPRLEKQFLLSGDPQPYLVAALSQGKVCAGCCAKATRKSTFQT